MRWLQRFLRISCGALAPLLLAAFTATAQTTQTAARGADVAEGQRIYLKNCALCHGGDATGGRGPDLSRGVFRYATTDDRLIDIVQNGILGTDMPWTGLSDRKARQVVAFIRSLSGREVALPGDASRGRELFFGAGTCNTCHMVDGKGGRQGPDLSWIGWQRAPDYLRAAVLDPSADVDPRWWTAEAVTTSGMRVVGFLIDEDQFAVRLIDEKDQLHALAKRDLQQFERTKTSKMPSLRGTLTDDQINDIVAFLSGLRGGGRDR